MYAPLLDPATAALPARATSLSACGTGAATPIIGISTDAATAADARRRLDRGGLRAARRRVVRRRRACADGERHSDRPRRCYTRGLVSRSMPATPPSPSSPVEPLTFPLADRRSVPLLRPSRRRVSAGNDALGPFRVARGTRPRPGLRPGIDGLAHVPRPHGAWLPAHPASRLRDGDHRAPRSHRPFRFARRHRALPVRRRCSGSPRAAASCIRRCSRWSSASARIR